MAPTDSLESKHRPWYRRWTWKRLVVRSLLLALLMIGGLTGWVYWQLHRSLPQLDGELTIAGLQSEATITRDELGTPTIVASSREDAAMALGVLHAHDRFFQMDLLRRVSSGRLCELLGEAPLRVDSMARMHRFEAIAQKSIADMPDAQRGLLAAYAQGVNNGLDSLGTVPPEYLLLRQKPQPWRMEDTLFVLLSMVQQLEPLDGAPKIAWTELQAAVPPEVFNFLVRKSTRFDVPLDGSDIAQPPIPPAEVWSLRESAFANTGDAQNANAMKQPGEYDDMLRLLSGRPQDSSLDVGSNCWAISGALSRSGSAIVANDMHLGLRVPATWYRAVIEYPGQDGQQRRLIGATLPGLPLLAAGSNGQVAWGLTASHSIIGDLVELQPVEGQPDHYMTPAGPTRLLTITDTIQIADGSTRTVDHLWSKWGPVVFNQGKRFVYRSMIHDPRAIDINMLGLESANTIEEAMQIANQSGTPRLNFIAGDAAGNVGWTIAGRLPKRLAAATPTAVDWSQTDNSWSELLESADYPRVVNPEHGRLWNANDRAAGTDYLELMGYGDLAFAARSKQIRDRLFAKDKMSEADMLAIQLDHEAIYMQWWHDLLMEVLKSDSKALSSECVKAVEQWGQKAAINSVGYRAVAVFRQQVMEDILGFAALYENRPFPKGSLADTLKLERGWVYINDDDVLLDLLEARPMHWLPARFESWDELLSTAARETEKRLTATGPIEQATWGQANTTAIQHPLSQALPFLSSWLDMPARQVPGDRNMPRVQGANFGASERMVVSPGREDEGYYHQPGGASGHFLSPFYRAGYEDWVNGTASPLLPGETAHTLRLVPAK